MEHDIIIERVPGEPAATAPSELAPLEATSELHGAGAMSPEVRALAAEITAALGETKRQPIAQITRVVGRLGADRTRAFLVQVREIEAGVTALT